jgi:O-antigen ligase
VLSYTPVLSRIATLLLVVGPFTTLAISPSSNYDPINLIKLIFVVSCAFSILLLGSSIYSGLFPRLDKTIWIVVGFFVFWMIMVFALNDSPINQQFWGVFGRNTGLLNYLSLVLILLGVALVQERRFYEKLVLALVLTAVPTTVYALIQLAGRDPIGWSVMAPFATLGNINFSSAFFGLASVCSTVIIFKPKLSVTLRLALVVLVVTDLLIVLETGSIQGFMIYLAGIGVAGYSVVRNKRPLRIFRLPYIIIGLITFVLTALALKNLGPLARFVFGDSILFRFDYWFAGWAMTLKNPLLGVGLDGYGDWYRDARGEIATLRTIPDRITNTAHNIYLDISASGGFPLLFAYLGLLFFAGRAAFRVFKREQHFNPYFVAIFSAWVAYLIQAAISINQIGVGIWGWLFTGALIGYERIESAEVDEKDQKKRSRSQFTQMPASAALLGLLGAAVGFTLAFIPFNADSKFKDAMAVGDPLGQFAAAKSLGATAFHMELALDASVKANNETLAGEIVNELLNRYPRDFMGWRLKQVLASSTPQERVEAYQMLRTLDPYNPDIKPTS